ncbi:helix-turn-helix domain-containing protein [Nocardia sienata]|uniref:helix-turn-helix domain-containing protein n=1 Tax=Nocardia sienata TaxID=248552 RepID=UPI001FDFDA03|nr:helix-turn-helix domain-containing protein [Nocardia sienata]
MTTTGRWEWNRVDVTVPVRLPAPGVRMAGFRYRDVASADITMIPHPSVTLLLDLSEAGVVFDVPGRLVTGNVIVGLRAGALRITGAAAGEVLQIRVSPVVAAAILRDTDIIGGTVISLAELWGSCVGVLTERLRSTPSWDERFALAAAFLRSRLPRGFGVAPEIAYAWDRTVSTKGLLRVETLAAETGWTRQRLWSRFRTHLGVSPKHASELVRFDRAAHLLAAGRSPADAAAEAGYVDQSHLHRRTKAITDMTPTLVARAPWLAIDEAAWSTT